MDQFRKEMLIILPLLILYLLTVPFIVGFLGGNMVWIITSNTPLTLMTALIFFVPTCAIGVCLANKLADRI